MARKASTTLKELVDATGRYPEEAFLFVRDGLNFAVDKIHGEETRAHRALAAYLADHDLDWNDLIAQYHTGQLDDVVMQAIDAAGGCEDLNRHVSGRELCWGLRDFALERWGLLAQVVLNSWRVRETADFGRIVFAYIEHDLMQRQPGDTLEDFEGVFDFSEAFDQSFRRAMRGEDDSPNSSSSQN